MSLHTPVFGGLLMFLGLGWAFPSCTPTPAESDPEVQSIKVTPDSVDLEVGGLKQFVARAFSGETDVTDSRTRFEWFSIHGEYVEIDPTGETVEARGLQEWAQGGSAGWNGLEVRLAGRPLPVGKAWVKVMPVANIQVSPSPIAVQVGQEVTVVAEATVSNGATVSVPTTWSLEDGTLASLNAESGSNTVVLTGLAHGNTTLRATVGSKESGPVAVEVAEPPPEPGVIYGVLYDVDEVTPLDSVNLTMGRVNAPAGSNSYRAKTGAPGPEPVPSGGFRFEVDAGQYAAFTVGVLGNRWVSTPGDTASVVAGDSTRLDLNVKRGYHLRMLETDLGTIQVPSGSAVNFVFSYQAWCRDLAPECSPAIAFGVDATPLAVYRLGAPGNHQGKTEQNVSIPVTVPDHGGTVYAMLVTASTSEANGGVQAGLDQYASIWERNIQATMLIPIGELIIN